ncbi:MAG: PTS sugar transporter subunit IIA [Clostridia bacterium]|nr:PTS sugar transporter subunit IIA [Clostridia bacterium]
MITDLLKMKTVKANVSASTWKEAARIVGGLLVDTGGAEPRYVDSMILSVEKYGPYIVITPGVALFHARPQDGVKEICMGLITLKSGVDFGAGEKDPVNLVFAFGASDNKTHLKVLSQIMTLLRDKAVVNQILKSNSQKEILEIIEKKFKI